MQANGKKSKKKKAKHSLVQPVSQVTSARLKQVDRDGPMLSHCAMDWAASLGDPFTGPEDACIPDFPAMLTQRQRCYVKGTFSTGAALSAGFGFILCDPSRAIANDRSCVITSTGTYAATVTTQTAGATVASLNSNSQFVAAQFGDDPLAQWRVVSAGLRLRYIGTELNRGGQMVLMHQPVHATLDNYSFSQLDAFAESARFPVDRKWKTVLFRHVERQDLEFNENGAPATGPDTFYMGAAIVSPDASGATPTPFEFEFFVNHEFQGRALRNKMPSHVDTTGFGAVHAAVALTPLLSKPTEISASDMAKHVVTAATNYLGKSESKPGNKSFLGQIGDTILDVGKTLLPVLGPLLTAIL